MSGMIGEWTIGGEESTQGDVGSPSPCGMQGLCPVAEDRLGDDCLLESIATSRWPVLTFARRAGVRVGEKIN